MKFFKHATFWIFLIVWASRIFKLSLIIKNGLLTDFNTYFLAVNNLFNKSQNIDLVLKASYGPPFVFLPFLIFINWSFKTAEIIFTAVNILAYFFSFYLLWKIYLKKITWLFWLLISLMSYSFPLIFSLGMGNPIGIVTLGIYSLFIVKNKFLKRFLFTVSSLIKIFPASVLIAFTDKKKEILNCLLFFTSGLMLSLVILPKDIWPRYLLWFNQFNPANTTYVNPLIYNQSFSSTLVRFIGSNQYSSLYYYLLILALFIIGGIFFFKYKITRYNRLDSMIFYLSLSLLIHPFPWQYYFAVLLPYLVLQTGFKRYYNLIPMFLISIDGNRFIGTGFIKYFLDGSQFFGTLILIVILFFNVFKYKNINI